MDSVTATQVKVAHPPAKVVHPFAKVAHPPAKVVHPFAKVAHLPANHSNDIVLYDSKLSTKALNKTVCHITLLDFTFAPRTPIDQS